MKLEEVHKTGMSDPEQGFEAHSRTPVSISFDISFAHEQGLEEAFTELLQHGYFQEQLEAAFQGRFKELAQKMIMSSKIPPGHGWMDDFETSVAVDVGPAQQVN